MKVFFFSFYVFLKGSKHTYCFFKVYKSNHLKGKANNVSADAAFKSQSKREVINFGDAKLKPAPCKFCFLKLKYLRLTRS